MQSFSLGSRAGGGDVASPLLLCHPSPAHGPAEPEGAAKAWVSTATVVPCEGGAGGSGAHPLWKVWSRTRAWFVQINNGL